MELRVLRYFLMVAQEGNITRAAQKLLVTQPTLSKQLAELEDELGTKLFIRGHRAITLTEAGEYLRTRATEMITIAEQTAANIQTDQVISGELTIGAGESIGMQRIMKVVSQIIQEYSEVKIHLISGNAQEMKHHLNQGTIDFAILMGQQDVSNYHSLQLPEKDHWGVLMLANDPLSNQKAISPADLVGHPLIISEQSLQENRFQTWWGNLGPRMKIIATFSLMFNAQLLVQNTGAYMLIFDHLINKINHDNLVFRPLAPKLEEPITVVWKKNTVQSKVAQLFVNQLKASL